MEVQVLITEPDETSHPGLDVIVYPDFREEVGEPDVVPWLRTIEVRIVADTDDPTEALGKALVAIAPLGGRIEKITVDRGELHRVVDGEERELPYPVVGVSEIARIRDVSRQYASRQSNVQGFPPVVANLSAGPVWQCGAVMRYLRDYEASKHGRARKRARY